MSAYHALVLNNVCRSNHHRIAIMALDHLKAAGNERWRDLFLKFHPEFLEGAKAPDEEFKDFKNHVCHPQDNFWGGAPQSAAEWYRRTVRALGQKDWQHAAWNAGVMSHYLADPCQPFHTGQSETEGAIHRAAEWSFSKSFPELKLIIEQHVRWPDVRIPSGEDWVGQAVRDAAVNANKHYSTVVEHFDFAAARKKPEAGLDQELKDIVARQLAYATVMLARVLDRAIAESKAEAPKVSLALSTLVLGLKKPLHVLLKTLDNAADRKVVEAQYQEFKRTGKVRHTLGEDDRLVRELHAGEVLKTHISSIDAEWPRELGLAHGAGAAPRVHRKLKGAPARATKAEGQAKPAPAKAPPQQKPARSAAKPAAKPAAPAPAPKAPEPQAQPPSSIRLTRDASVVDAPSIGPKTAGRLSVIGVRTIGDLLDLSPDDAAKQIKQSHINARIITDWQAQALLACSVPGLSGTSAQLLVGAGVTSMEDLATSDPDTLADAIQLFAASNEGERALRGGAVPDRERVRVWVEAALEICEGRTAA